VKIFDFHVHAGKFDLLREDIRGLLKKFPFEKDVDVTEIFSSPLILKSYLQRNGVSKAVILAECGPGTNYSIDSQMISDFGKNDPFYIPFGSINPNHHKDPVAEWQHGMDIGIQGYKFYPADHDFDPFSTSMMSVYDRCEEAGQPIMFHTGLTAQKDAMQRFINPSDYRDLVESHPNLKVIFAHGGKPNWYNEALTMALEYENVYLDTALVPPEYIVRWVNFDSEIKHKVLFASDLPVSGSYSAVIDRLLNSGIDNKTLKLITFDNAENVLSCSNQVDMALESEAI
jgi:predicted TIM-barrel fold metal-dependent hydrolase